MNILIIGAGKVGMQLAKDMTAKNHKVKLIEKDEEICSKIEKNKNLEIYCGDGCDPLVLELAGIKIADIIAAVTGDDEDNLVVAQLAKLQPNRPKVIAIINHPKNEWLFNKKWGVDASVSSTAILSRIIEEDMGMISD
ncbi:MAG: TrkA family potassium uptake protein [Actinobacteria bacterium]|nr:TrkA family potassium uptake protein [Actinomycetota bacterium]